MDLDHSLQLISEIAQEVYDLQKPPHVGLVLVDEGWRLQISHPGLTKPVFDRTRGYPSMVIIDALDFVAGLVETKYGDIARLRDRLLYLFKDPDQKTLGFGRRINVEEQTKPPDDIPF